jgi:hypothetical protein
MAVTGASLAASPKPVPRVQAVPLPRGEVAFECDGRELCRLHAGDGLRRPFLYPVNGPSGLSLTRMGHPHDPVSHSHHNSVWLSHAAVNGRDFWADSGDRITNCLVTRLDDGDASAVVDLRCSWRAPDGAEIIRETRSVTARPSPRPDDGRLPEWLMIVDSRLEATSGPVTFGDTAFGLIGVRLRRSIGVTDGGGTIRNSAGGVDEQGCFRRPARWVDYSGPVLDRGPFLDRGPVSNGSAGESEAVIEGVALFDHPANPGHPVPFHVRDDGWMGACLSFGRPITLEKGKSLRVRYGLWIHSGSPASETIEKEWRAFAALPTDPE